MCGRYATTRSAADLSALFESYDDTAGSLASDYNVAPTDPVPIVRMSQRRAGRILTTARWGLVPTWAPDVRGGARMINARAETVATLPAFRASFARRRCLVPADGWYEWVRRDGRRQAYFMTPHDGSVLAFAGLWSVWGEGPDPLTTCSVVTTAARGQLSTVHDRMPLLVPRHRWAGWLTGDPHGAALLEPPPDDALAAIEIRPVGAAVGDVRNEGPELIARVAPDTGVDATPLTLF